MSTTGSSVADRVESASEPDDITAIRVPATVLDSTAPSYLRDLKADLAADGYHPSTLVVTSEDEVDGQDDLRTLVRTAALLGVGRLEMCVEEGQDYELTAPLVELAASEGIHVVTNAAGVEPDATED